MAKLALIFLAVCVLTHLPLGWSFEPTMNLPDLYVFENGSAVTTAADWSARRSELRNLLQQHITGTFPAQRPTLVSATTVDFRVDYDSVRISNVSLVYEDPKSSKKFELYVEMMMPMNPEEKYPVFITQTTHRRWASAAVGRNYLTIVTPTGDQFDQTDQLRTVYPENSWGLIGRRAWTTSIIVDWIYTLSEANVSAIAITGHSRNGKQSLLATAFDDRITAVISSSAGAPCATPFRMSGHEYFGEPPNSPIFVLDEWWVSTLAAYVGREDELPVDANAVLSLVAPRHLLLSTAYNDAASDIMFSNEHSLLSAQRAWTLLGTPSADRTFFLRRFGDHRGFIFVDLYLDWLDYVFGRRTSLPRSVSKGDDLPHVFDWKQWNATTENSERFPPSPSESPEVRIRWTLGDALPQPHISASEMGAEYSYVTDLYGHEATRDLVFPTDVYRIGFSFGRYVKANLYVSKAVLENATSISTSAMIWAHPFSYHRGYMQTSYDTLGLPAFLYEMAAKNVIVMAFDHIGFGNRQDEAFEWTERMRGRSTSKMMQMVGDIQAAVDVLQCLTSTEASTRTGDLPDWCKTYAPLPSPLTSSPLPRFRSNGIFVVGYSLGGMAALHAAALDDRISGVASFSGFTPFRNDTGNVRTGGMRRWWDLHGLIPRLGWFEHSPGTIPYDYDDILALVSPRPTLLYTPKLDKFSNFAAVNQCIEHSAEFWSESPQNLTHVAPDDVSAFGYDEYQAVLQWAQKSGFIGKERGGEKVSRLRSGEKKGERRVIFT